MATDGIATAMEAAALLAGASEPPVDDVGATGEADEQR